MELASLPSLKNKTRHYLNAHISKRTAKNYRKKHAHYKKFCTQLNIYKYSEKSLSLYASHLAEFQSYNYILQCLTAIKHYRKRFKKPRKLIYLKQVLSGIKRTITTKSATPPRLPITPKKLRTIKRFIETTIPSKENRNMVWCAMLFGFYGFLRISEYTNPNKWKYSDKTRTLTSEDIDYHDDYISINLKKSKTDQGQQGTTITLARNDTGLCPIKAYQKYIKSRSFQEGPFFVFKDSSFLTPQTFNQIIKSALPPTQQGVYSSHSLRSGAASTAAAKGYPTYIIQSLGRWSSEAYRTYIQINNDFCSKISSDLASCEK